MWKWIHHLLEPHCEQCKAEREENKVCSSCETYKVQLEIANYEKRELLKTVLESMKPQVSETKVEIPEPLKPRAIPWRIRQQMLEEEDRAKAKTIADNQKREAEAKANADRAKEIEQLEKELNIPVEKEA